MLCMVVIQARSRRKATGGRYKKSLILKRKHEMGRPASMIKLGDVKLKKVRTLGGNEKLKLARINVINIVDMKTQKPQKVKILTILENPANRHYVRRNIVTMGTIVETEVGKARITNRPGQDGTLNGVLI